MSPAEERRPAPAANEDVTTEDLSKLVEEARQAVKQVIKRELEGEVVGEGILGFRLKGRA